MTAVQETKTRRGTTNGNARGSNETRARRRAYLLEEYAADVHVLRFTQAGGYVHGGPTSVMYPSSPAMEESWADPETLAPGETVERMPTARCFHCGCLLWDDPDQGPNHITVDRIVPGYQGGTYRRTNIRPACAKHNSELGAKARHATTNGHTRPRRPEPRRTR